MAYVPGGAINALFTISGAGGGLANADSLPTATMYHNAAIDGTVTFTVTNVATGIYKAVGTVPGSYTAGDSIALFINATVSGISLGYILDQGALGSTTVTAAAIASAVFAQVVLGSYTFTNLLQGFASILFGKNSGMATTTNTFRDVNDTKNVVVATTDTSGNRTAITFTP